MYVPKNNRSLMAEKILVILEQFAGGPDKLLEKSVVQWGIE